MNPASLYFVQILANNIQLATSIPVKENVRLQNDCGPDADLGYHFY